MRQYSVYVASTHTYRAIMTPAWIRQTPSADAKNMGCEAGDGSSHIFWPLHKRRINITG